MYNRQCDYFVINDDVAECVKKVQMIIPSDCDFCPYNGAKMDGDDNYPMNDYMPDADGNII